MARFRSALKSFFIDLGQRLLVQRQIGDQLAKFTGQSDDALINLEYDVLIKALPTSGQIERKWLEFALQLSRDAGMTELAPIDQFYTNKFAKVSAS